MVASRYAGGVGGGAGIGLRCSAASFMVTSRIRADCSAIRRVLGVIGADCGAEPAPDPSPDSAAPGSVLCAGTPATVVAASSGAAHAVVAAPPTESLAVFTEAPALVAGSGRAAEPVCWGGGPKLGPASRGALPTSSAAKGRAGAPSDRGGTSPRGPGGDAGSRAGTPRATRTGLLPAALRAEGADEPDRESFSGCGSDDGGSLAAGGTLLAGGASAEATACGAVCDERKGPAACADCPSRRPGDSTAIPLASISRAASARAWSSRCRSRNALLCSRRSLSAGLSSTPAQPSADGGGTEGSSTKCPLWRRRDEDTASRAAISC